jgi:FAD-dependent urate hydroxylase
MRVMIVGGGISGLVLGIALRQHGLDAHVYEATSSGAGGAGAFLQIAPNGVNALGALGLARVPEQAGGFPTSGLSFLNGRGREIGRLDSSSEEAEYGAANALVTRAGLHEALGAAAAAHGVPVVRTARLVDYRETSDGVAAGFADGRTAAGDVLLGCDGVASPTRRRMLQPGPDPRYTGLMNLGGFVRCDLPDAGEPTARTHMIFGRRAFFGWTAAPDGSVYWFSNVPQPIEPRLPDGGRTPQEWLTTLRRLHADDPAPIPEILAVADEPAGAWPVFDLPPLPTWHTRRACLVGDAAHAMSPSAGQGASIAIEDAVVLGACLRDEPTPAAAFARYEHLRKGRAEAVAAQSRRNGSHKVPGPVGGAVRDLLLPLFLRLGARQARATYGYTVGGDLDRSRVEHAQRP